MKKLSSREREILQLIAHECTTREIADKLFISPDTVKTHRGTIQRKLNARNSPGMVRIAFERGLLTLAV